MINPQLIEEDPPEILTQEEKIRIFEAIKEIKSHGLKDQTIISILNDRTKFGKGRIKRIFREIYALKKELK